MSSAFLHLIGLGRVHTSLIADMLNCEDELKTHDYS